MAPPITKDNLSETEQKIINAINSNKDDEVSRLLQEPGVRIECLDKSGMTFLQHAAYRGSKTLCQLFLRQGADVNTHRHDQGYTTLMFAALTGKEDVVQLLLEAGAVKSQTNKVNRTASQMAAFVGQHRVASLISNFYSREELDYYTVPHGFEKEPKLPVEIAGPVHQIILLGNLRPVKLLLVMRDNDGLLLNCYKIAKIFDLMATEAFQGKDCNEVFSVKIHYFAELVRKCDAKFKSGDEKLDLFIKSLVRGRDSDGYLENEGKIIRECLKTYPYVDSRLFQQVVRQLASTDVGSYPTTFETLRAALFGPMNNSDEENACETCGSGAAEKRCTNCKKVHYCNQICQKLNWFMHKKFCKSLADQYKEEQLEKERLEAEERAAKAQQDELKKAAANDGNKINGDSKVDSEQTESDKTSKSKIPQGDISDTLHECDINKDSNCADN